MVVLIRLLLLALTTTGARADWYEGEGEAPVLGSDRGSAYESAGRESLRSALIAAGASVSLVKDVGVESQPLSGGVTYRTADSGHVGDVQVLEEGVASDRVTIRIRANITQPGKVCGHDLVSKAVVLAPLAQDAPDQAAWGGLERMPEAASSRLLAAFRSARADFLVTHVLSGPVALDSQHWREDSRRQVEYLADHHHSQLVVFGRINNLTLGRNDDDLVREFAMTLSLVDGLSGDPILTRSYATRTYWPFAPTDRVGADSDRLWASPYGLEISRLMHTAVGDMADAVACGRPKTRVIRVRPNRLDVAIGARQGIQTGALFKVLYQDNFTDAEGTGYASFSDSGATFEVVHVYPDHSTLAPVEGQVPGSIRIRDLVQLDDLWE